MHHSLLIPAAKCSIGRKLSISAVESRAEQSTFLTRIMSGWKRSAAGTTTSSKAADMAVPPESPVVPIVPPSTSSNRYD